MPDEDIEITGFLSANRHNINFMVDGELYGSIADVPFDSIVPLLPEPTKTGYTFSGWNCQYKNMPDEDIEIAGSFEINRHTITYVLNGEIYQTIEKVEFGSEITLLEAPEKEGYSFIGWNCTYTTMPDEDITITGSLKMNLYTITYLLDGEPYQMIADVPFGTKIELMEAPTKEGHTFSGWVCGYETMPDKNITITGSFEVNQHSITYLVDGELYQITDDVPFGIAINLMEEPVKEGHTFSGWVCEYDTMPDRDVIVTGEFKINTHSITFQLDGTTYQVIENVPFGSKIELAEDPIKKGYTFNGWKSEYETMPDKDIIIKGSFTIKTCTIIVTAENGTVSGDATYEFGTIATLTATADSGYHFVRWSDENKENPRTIAITANLVENNSTLELTAIFEQDEETWISDSETETIPVKIYAYDNTITIENADAEIFVYNTAGSLIAQVAQPVNYTEIPVANAGVYIVKVGGTRQKVVIGNK